MWISHLSYRSVKDLSLPFSYQASRQLPLVPSFVSIVLVKCQEGRITTQKEKQKFGIKSVSGNEDSEKKYIGELFIDAVSKQLQQNGCKL